MKKLGVVIVTYNRLELLKECIYNCINQSYKFNKIIIVNNASSDGTEEYLRHLTYDNVVIVTSKENFGGAGGYYLGVKEANKYNLDYLLFIDDDAIIDENYNKNIVNAITSNVYAYSGTVKTNGIIQYGADIDDETWNDEIERLQMEADNVEKGLLILRGATYTSASRKNRDMEYQGLMKDIRDRVLATYGVPPQRVSIIEVANLGSGSGESQNKQFKKTFNGKAKLFEDAYNRILGKGGFEEFFQYGEIDIEDKHKNAVIDNIRLNNGSLTINEVRSTYELSPVPWGDQPLGMQQQTGTIDEELQSLGGNSSMDMQDLISEIIGEKNRLVVNKTLDEIYHNV